MRLLIVLITYNRLEYTQRTLKSLSANTSNDLDYYLVISDNASTDGTQDFIKKVYRRNKINDFLLHEQNFYPGKAANQGWMAGLDDYDATHLMRLDNDIELQPDWDKRVEAYFKAIPELGQLGIEHEAIETPDADLMRVTINGMTVNKWPGVVGGPMIMPRRLWNKGVRYDESPWQATNPQIPTEQEDSKLSKQIKEMGYLVGHAQEELGRTFANESNWSKFPDYYIKTMSERGYGDNVTKIKENL